MTPVSPGAGAPGVILLAHGSRHRRAAAGIDQLAAAVHRHTGRHTVAAHLSFHDHTFDHACHQLRSRGHTRATVVPLLFTNAYHHTIDVPNTVAKEDQLDITITPGLGTGPAVAELLRSQIPAGAHPVLYAVGSSRPEANRSVEKLAHTIGGEPLFATRGTPTGRTLDDIRTTHHRVHILPLFVSHGLLLDQLRTHHPPTEHLSYSPPLMGKLATIVKRRLQCSSSSQAHSHN